jgi:hypothetical protein
MNKLLFALIGLIFLTFVGCTERIVVDNKTAAVTGDEKTAIDFINLQGYTVTAKKGERQRYVLEKSKLYGEGTMIYQQVWGVQTVKPDKYFGKEIVVYGFTVKNHPMQKSDKEHTKNGVNVYIMLSEGKVIGGYSYPNADVAGAFSSLDGKTLEEITGLSFQEWRDNWEKKYGN